jgi:hypothetical protein
MRSLFRITGIAILAIAQTGMNTFAADRVDPVNTNGSPVAIEGYDVTAYFTKGQPQKGAPQFTQDWMGATWRFASAEARDTFAGNPQKFAPQYGGYCAWAVSRNYTAKVDPAAWKIVDGKLYLNYNKSVQKKWEADIAGNIGKADTNWPQLHR